MSCAGSSVLCDVDVQTDPLRPFALPIVRHLQNWCLPYFKVRYFPRDLSARKSGPARVLSTRGER